MKAETLLLTGLLCIAAVPHPKKKIDYPKAQKVDTVDVYFGNKVADPYRWMENDKSAETTQWVAEEKKNTQQYFNQIPFRKALYQRLIQLSNYERYTKIFKKNGTYYFFKNNGLQNQNVLYSSNTLDGKQEVVIDPNTLSTDGTVAFTGIYFSKNKKFAAYTISRKGSDWEEIYVKDMQSGKLLNDHIKWAKFTGVSWSGNGFYYSGYDTPKRGKEYSNINKNHKIFYHEIGTPQSEDKLFFQNPDKPKSFYTTQTSDNERLLYIFESGIGSGNNLSIKDLTDPNSNIIQLTSENNFQYEPIGLLGDKIYIYTNYKAPKFHLMCTSLSRPQIENWEEVIPESENLLEGVDIIDNKLFCTYSVDITNRVYVSDLNGKRLNEIKLPGLGMVTLSGEQDDKECFIGFSSFTYPFTLFTYNTATNKLEKLFAPKISFNPDEYETKQIFFTSKDGTKVPMFLNYKKGIKLNGNNPILMYGYGGFGINLKPSYSGDRIPFLESGGIYVQVNLRGGNEYGEQWHKAGTKMNKQNVFDDFISAAEYLINNKYTNSGKLSMLGGSNGGLLVGACMTQRPELFKVAIPAVGVMDMLRYHKFTIGWNWASDYGTSDDSKEMFEYLKGYSPLHNLKPGVKYPATLILTADHDDRVVPAHSFKFAATLQECNAGTSPIIIRIESNAGHGGGMPLSKKIEEQADIYSFIMYNVGMKPTFPKE